MSPKKGREREGLAKRGYYSVSHSVGRRRRRNRRPEQPSSPVLVFWPFDFLATGQGDGGGRSVTLQDFLCDTCLDKGRVWVGSILTTPNKMANTRRHQSPEHPFFSISLLCTPGRGKGRWSRRTE